MATTQNIIIDLNTRGANPVAFTHQGDTERAFVFEVYNKGEAFSLTGYTAKIGAMLPADNGYYVIAGNNMTSGTISDNKITATLPSTYTARHGNGILTIILTKNSASIRPINIDLRIQKSADAPDVIAGASDFPAGLEEIADAAFEEYLTNYLPPVAPSADAAATKSASAKLTGEALDGFAADMAQFQTRVENEISTIDYDQLAFGESTGVQKIYFTGNVPTTATSYGTFGRVIQCSAGDTIYMSGALSTQNITNVKILSAIPSGQFGAIPNASIIGTLEQTENNVYAIPSNLTSCVAAFFPGTFKGMLVSDYAGLTNGVIEETSSIGGYKAGSNQVAKRVSKLPFSIVNEYIVAFQKESFWVGDDYNKAFYASLFKSVSPLVNAKIALLGDSLSEQSALPNDYRDGWLGKIVVNYSATARSWAQGQQRWYNTTSLPHGAVYQVNQLLASDFVPDYVILEFGTNDIWSGSSSFGSYGDAASDTTQKTSCAIRWCVETLQENYPNARILCIMPMLRNNNGLKPPAQDTYITLADQILDDYSIHRVYPYTDSGIVYDMMKEDGIHLAKMVGLYYDNANSVAVKKYSAIVHRGLLEL